MSHSYFFYFLQEYHHEIDKLKQELQSSWDKDGVFLPKDHYEEQLRAKEWADKEIQEKTLLLKAMEEELEKFKVGLFLLLPKQLCDRSKTTKVIVVFG